MIPIIKWILQVSYIIIKKYMNKYTYIILVLAIGIIATTFWYTSPTQQWERQSKLYQEQIKDYKKSIEDRNKDSESKLQQIQTLSGQIQMNKNINE